MFNQTLKNICSLFSPGKKSIFSDDKQENKTTQETSLNASSNKVTLLYNRNAADLEMTDPKSSAMQHDWWIN